jgi:hypothetical protein
LETRPPPIPPPKPNPKRKKSAPVEEKRLKVPTGAILSKYLRALALDIESMDDSGDPVTKAQKLAELVWKHALGFTDEKDPTKRIPPATWAIELLFNRVEGKIPLAVVEDQGRSLTDKVSDLGKAKANSLAEAASENDDG